jgi:hypothetical protein
MRTSYVEKLKDPRWQKKRLEVLQRDEWSCTMCGDKESTLHVHHNRYVKGRDPWEYPASELRTLCVSCHEEETDLRKEAEGKLIEVLQLCGFSSCDVDELANVISVLPFGPHLWPPTMPILRLALGRWWKELCSAYFKHLKDTRKKRGNH